LPTETLIRANPGKQKQKGKKQAEWASMLN
jgi:hypothetical protein